MYKSSGKHIKLLVLSSPLIRQCVLYICAFFNAFFDIADSNKCNVYRCRLFWFTDTAHLAELYYEPHALTLRLPEASFALTESVACG